MKNSPLKQFVFSFKEDSFVPVAKLQNGERFSILADHLGTPIIAGDNTGEKVWFCKLDIYGKLYKLQANVLLFLLGIKDNILMRKRA